MAALANARDVAAGFPAGKLAAGVLFRGDAPASGDTPPPLPSWPPATVVDLRGERERGDSHALGDVALVHSTPVLDSADPAVIAARTADAITGVYKFMVEQSGPAAGLVAALEATAAGPAPVYLHCTAGRDRTGVAVALILRLLGFGRDEVVGEYMLTDLHTDALAERLYDLGVVRRRRTGADFQPTTEPIDAVLDVWDAHPGGPRGWFLNAGGTTKTISDLEELLLGGDRR